MRTLFLLISLCFAVQAGDPFTRFADQPNGKAPKFELLSPTPTIPPKVVEPPKSAIDQTKLPIGIFRWYGVKHTGPVTYKVEGDAAKWKEFTKETLVFGKTDMSPDEDTFTTVPPSLVLWGVKPGTVRLLAWGVEDNKAKELASLTITVGPRPPPEGGEPPPVVTPGPVKKTLYFMIIRPSGPASQEFQNTMALPAWSELRKAGHKIADYELGKANEMKAQIPDGTVLPAVLPLAISADGKTSTRIPPPLVLPTTDAGIRALGDIKP